MSSMLILDQIDQNYIRPLEFVMKINNCKMENGYGAEEVPPEGNNLEHPQNSNYSKPVENENDTFQINMVLDHCVSSLNIGRLIVDIEKYGYSPKYINQESKKYILKEKENQVKINDICSVLMAKAEETMSGLHAKPKKNVYIDEQIYHKWNYHIKNIRTMNKKIKIKLNILNMMGTKEYSELFKMPKIKKIKQTENRLTYKCYFCELTFNSAKKLKKHRKIHRTIYGKKLTLYDWEYGVKTQKNCETYIIIDLKQTICEICNNIDTTTSKLSGEFYSHFFCNVCNFDALIVPKDNSYEVLSLCDTCGKLNGDQSHECN